MARERITETLQPSRKIIRAFEVAKCFAGENPSGLAPVTITFSDNRVLLTAINWTDGMAVNCPLEGIKSSLSGSFSVDIRFLNKLLKTAGKEDLQFSFLSKDLFADFSFLVVRGENTFSCVSFKKGDKIILEHGTDKHANFEVLARNFTSALETVGFAAAKKNSGNSEPFAILIDFEQHLLRATATDGYRFCQLSQLRNASNSGVGSFVISSACADRLSWLVKTETGGESNAIKIFTSGEDYLRFDFRDYQVYDFSTISPELFEKFTGHERAIPPEDELCTRVQVNAGELQKAIAVVQPKWVGSIVLNVESPGLIISSDGSHKRKKRQKESYSFDIKGSVQASVCGRPVEVRLNPTYILEFLERVLGSEVEIGFSGAYGPVVFRSVRENQDLICLLMPMRRVE